MKVYVSPNEEKDYLEKGKADFPIGTVIVKEKLLNKDENVPYALGAMLKEKDLKTQKPIWKFLYIDHEGKISQGEEAQSCFNCHQGARNKDFVFGWN